LKSNKQLKIWEKIMKLQNILKYYLVLFLCTTPIVRIEASAIKNRQVIAYWAAGIGAVSALTCGIWAYRERSAKHKVQSDLEGRKIITNASEHIKYLERVYSPFFGLFKDANFVPQERVKLYSTL